MHLYLHEIMDDGSDSDPQKFDNGKNRFLNSRNNFFITKRF